MKPTDWVKKYAAMDKRVELKFLYLPKGEQIGKRPVAPRPDAKKSYSPSPQRFCAVGKIHIEGVECHCHHGIETHARDELDHLLFV